MPRAAPPATADDGSSTAAAPEPSMTSVSTTTVTDPSSVNTESAGVEDAESSQGGEPAQPEPGKGSATEEEALLRPKGTQSACAVAGAGARARPGGGLPTLSEPVAEPSSLGRRHSAPIKIGRLQRSHRRGLDQHAGPGDQSSFAIYL